MPDQPSPQSDNARLNGAALLTLSGIGAAFGVAACCALPIMLATAGIGTAWLAGIASVTAPHRAGCALGANTPQLGKQP